MDAETLLGEGTPLCKHVSKVLFLPNKGSVIVKKMLHGYIYTAEGILENAGIYVFTFYSGLLLMRLLFWLSLITEEHR